MPSAEKPSAEKPRHCQNFSDVILGRGKECLGFRPRQVDVPVQKDHDEDFEDDEPLDKEEVRRYRRLAATSYLATNALTGARTHRAHECTTNNNAADGRANAPGARMHHQQHR